MIRLIGRNSVEEIILKRAEDKLKLTDTVIEKGEFDSVEPSTSKQSLTKDAGQVCVTSHLKTGLSFEGWEGRVVLLIHPPKFEL